MTTPRSSADWAATREQARRCLELAVELVRAADGLDMIGAGGGSKLPRRLVLAVEAFERICETSDRQHEITWKAEEREARLERLAAERERAREATYGRRSS